MEVLINIPQKAYEQIVGFPQQTAGVDILILHKILQEGKVLPKGHGRLVDMDAVLRHIKEPMTKCEFLIRMEAEKVLDADKETIDGSSD